MDPLMVCTICDKALESDIITVQQKGLKTLIAKSTQLGDNKWKVWSDHASLTVHDKCRKWYASASIRSAAARAAVLNTSSTSSAATTSTSSSHSESVPTQSDFNFRDLCLICGKPWDRLHKQGSLVQHDYMKERLLHIAEKRNDSIAIDVIDRLRGVASLVAVGARYHKKCKDTYSKITFEQSDGISRKEEIDSAFQLVSDHVKRSEKGIFTLTELRKVMGDKCFSTELLYRKLMDFFGDDIHILQQHGSDTLIFHKCFGMTKLCGEWYSDPNSLQKQRAESTKSFETVQWEASAAAGILHHQRIERNKRVFTDAVNYCLLLLKRSDRMSNESSRVPSGRAKLLGHEMFEKIVSLDVEGESAVIDEVDGHQLDEVDGHQLDEVDGHRLDEVDGHQLDEVDGHQLDVKDHLLVEGDEQVAGQNLDDANMWKLEVDDDDDDDDDGHRIEDIKGDPDVGQIIPEGIEGGHRVGNNDDGNEAETDETLPQNVVSMNLDEEEHCPSPSSTPPPPSFAFIACDSNDPYDTDDSSDEPYEKTRNQLFVFNLEVKRRYVKLAKKNPTWSIEALRKESSGRVRSLRQLKKWEKQIADGGTIRDKHDAVNTWTYSRFVEARDNFQYVADAILRKWVTQAAFKYFGSDYVYNTDQRWLKKFKHMYEIKGNSAVGYYKKSEKVKRCDGKK